MKLNQKRPLLLALTAIALMASHASISVAAPSPDSDMEKVLKELASKNGKPIETLTADEARKQPTPTDAVLSLMTKEKKDAKIELAEVKEIQVDGAAGKLPARVYIPKAKGKEAAMLPVVVYYHGGGFVIATNDTYDATPRSLAEQTGAIFVSVEYRKAPEFKFPAAHDDAFAAYQWVINNAKTFGGDPKKVAVAGESAGGNLAINVSIAARDKKIQMPLYQLLVYPVASNNMTTESYTKNADAKPLNKPMMEWFVKNYTRTPADANDPRLNLLAANLAGLPSTTIITAEIDPLQTEGKQLADRLKDAGTKVDYKNYEGVTHEFFGMAAVVKDAKAAQKLASNDLKGAFKAAK